MADAEVKNMSTIIFFSTTMQHQLDSIMEFAEYARSVEKCEHKILMHPLTTNVFQFIRGENGDVVGCHEIIFCPDGPTRARLENTKNVTLSINCMSFVGKNDKKKYKKEKIINWLLEEMEEIRI